ncbi:MAG: restriction endonuclease [Candidatus Kapaibacterium sp.]|nr:MAG: restriction endonuclease [Candidatus Kapabacteria bacterium]
MTTAPAPSANSEPKRDVFKEQLAQIQKHVQAFHADILTEEGAKTAFILPFINFVLGYDIFNPLSVMPEYNADVGMKKGEKVDYAILMNGTPVILIECKQASDTLSVDNAAQLYRYFSVTPAKIAILTNGVQYKFFSDTEEINKMDLKPFLEFDMRTLDMTNAAILDQIRSFSREHFKIDEAGRMAIEMKYAEGIKQFLFKQVQEPSDDFAATLLGAVYPGRRTAKAIEQFRPVVQKAFLGFLEERVAQVVRAMNIAAHNSQYAKENGMDTVVNVVGDAATGKEIITTVEELEGFYLVKSLLTAIVLPERVSYKDTLSYCAVILDNNVRKTICRLYFNNTEKKQIGVFEANTEKKYDIQTLSDVYKFAEPILTMARYHDQKTMPSAAV